MANITDATESFLHGLSDLWLRFFKDKNQLEAMYQATEVLIGQAYLDMVSNVLNVSAREAPIFNKEFFKLLVLRENDVTYDIDADRHVFGLAADFRAIPYLHNKIYAPTVILENGLDYDITNVRDENDEIHFVKNPFDWNDDGTDVVIPGVATRTVQVEDSSGNVVSTREIAFWCPDAQLDHYNLYLTHGYLLNRFEPSSEAYRALIRGVSRYFILGPTIDHLVSTLNVIVGLPVIRDEGEILQEVDQSDSLVNVVKTDRADYTFQKDVPLRTDILDSSNWESYTFKAFEHLTLTFQVKDSVSDPTWWYDTTVPLELLPDEPRKRRILKPLMFENIIDNPPGLVNIGDPGFFIGADEDGFAVVDPPGPTDRLGRRHLFSYIVFERWLKQHVFAVVFDDSLLAADTSVPFPKFSRDIEQIVVAGKSAYVYMYFEPELVFEDGVTIADERTLLVRWNPVTPGVVQDSDIEEVVYGIDNTLMIGGRSWSIGDFSLLKYRTLTFGGTYTFAVSADVGKAVVGGTTGDTGILASFNNVTKEWIVVPDEWATDTFDQVEPITITTGIGTGTTTGASTIGTEPYVGNEGDDGGSIHPIRSIGETPVMIGGSDPHGGAMTPYESGLYAVFANAGDGSYGITTLYSASFGTSKANVLLATDVGLWLKNVDSGQYLQITQIINAYTAYTAPWDIFLAGRKPWSLWRHAGEGEAARYQEMLQVKVIPIP